MGHKHSPSCDVAVLIRVISFFFFEKKYCRKTIEASIMKKLLNESKLIYAIKIFIVASWCLLFSHGSHLTMYTHSNIC